MEISAANERKWPQIKVKGPGSMLMAGQSRPICVDLRSLAAKKSFRRKSRADVIDISVWLYE